MRSWKYVVELKDGEKLDGKVGLQGLKVARLAMKEALDISKDFKVAVKPLNTLLIEYCLQMLRMDEDIISIQIESHEKRR